MHELCALMSLMLANEYHHATITRISDCKWESVASYSMKGGLGGTVHPKIKILP